MNTYAVIQNNTIVNIVLWDGVTPYAPQGVLTPLASLPQGVDIGWTVTNGTWGPPTGG